jgi:hypothetical protein
MGDAKVVGGYGQFAAVFKVDGRGEPIDVDGKGGEESDPEGDEIAALEKGRGRGHADGVTNTTARKLPKPSAFQA